ncbi:MAG: site-specific integrase [Pirellulaceae bacterium]|nr:site-specific integrase [Pirellulaceae bacterium]
MQRKAPRTLNFTKVGIDGLDPPEGSREYHYDEQVRGLAICVTPAGTKTFYVVRRIPSLDGRPSKVEFCKIGPWPTYTVEMARDEAARINGKVADGINPNDKRRAARQAPTFRAVFDEFINLPTRTKAKRPKSAATVKGYRQQFELYLAPWHTRQLSTVTRPDVEKLHNELSKAHGIYTANRVLALVKAIFNAAIDLEWFAANPAARVPAFEEQSRDRFLQADEFPKFWAALEAEPSEKIRDFVKLALFTGQRRSNVLAMKWADLNLERAVWTIPQTKTGRHDVPLTAEALDVLRRRYEARGESEWVFPAHHGGGPLKDPMRQWRDILTRAGIDNLRIHDLRRTMGSWQTMTGSSRPVVGKLMGHSREETTAIYGRLDMATVRDSAATATAAMLAAAKPKAKRGKKGVANG